MFSMLNTHTFRGNYTNNSNAQDIRPKLEFVFFFFFFFASLSGVCNLITVKR